MSIDYRIIAPSEAADVLADPDHEPRAPLGSLGDVRHWLTQRVANMTPDHDRVSCHIGTGRGSAWVHFWTVEAYKSRRDNYVPRDDYAVTTISFMAYGDFDFTVIGECAARFGGTIFDHQTSEMLAPEEFLHRLRLSDT